MKLSRQIYRKHQINFDLVEVKENILTELCTHYSLFLPKIKVIYHADDLTVKFLLEYEDGKTAEAVLIPFYKRYTLCLSTQVGCAMGCSFCFTGTQGLKRHLSASEIIGQYLVAWHWLLSNRPEKSVQPNIVFMGQGEPLHNFDEVKKATELFLEKNGVGLGPRQITLSTAGYLPGLSRFHEFPPINLALSLHSTSDEVRNKLIPLNKTFNIRDLFIVLDQIPLMKRQYITFEYLMIKDLNMNERDVVGLKALLGPRKAILNLIPFNPFPGSHYLRPLPDEVENFKQALVKQGLHVMLRTTKGENILAACGQLTSK